MTVTRSSGSGMRDLPCAGGGNSHPGFSSPGFSRPGFRHQLLHAFATGQERCNKPESSAAKALLLTSSGAREQESKRARESKKSRKRTRTRKQEQEKEQEQEREKEQEQESKREKKNGKTPSLLRRIILRLGLVTP